ncbi:DUF3120 domain-containing protein [Nodularia spumigena]|jgi:hypothetical protein|uniref:DUF3120 domain-containing protein n=2 Tax=Nodularia spumigena TaxID=70799 RepID=A0ABU5URM9_NODSP|nr:DUF3120 domain-containing protein [Nodularia spumigena]AHJ26559.1 Permeases of the major facilitator superfamily [Nodularia spumigena CCY9414]EAW46179.1 hypothetical protein N9414_19772 [Nodularia spumigena CCY9414]MDB9319754.1 DUF3120 domain-containing protein [Nodularia spumigena CS-590/01A]MDB9324694.1 DUF3120 domain-containing protein [Nodularia spumigena CS-590/02]MDB9335011.1 DUF3120 domain-containing protein [Nodularia spumigena CS-590/01]
MNTDLPATEFGQKSIRELESTLAFSPSIPISTAVRETWLVLAAAVFLVSVPVFIEAPLVRSLPVVSVAITGFWVWLSLTLMSSPKTYLWGDLLFGFSWSWLAGAIYWGWLRWEPLWHLPIESIALPFACWCLLKNWGKVGNWFYLGSLLGTVLTDVYFYLVDLMPYWRQIMQVEPNRVPSILQSALIQVQTPWGQGWAVMLALALFTAGVLPLRTKQTHWYAFSGAVLSTILVDSLFLIAANAA